MKNRIKALILTGDFNNAEKMLLNKGVKFLRELLVELGYESENMIVYSFICSIICKNENAELHNIASRLLSLPLRNIPGAYNSALYHARKAVELDPSNILYKENLLLFYAIPDGLISEAEANCIAQEVFDAIPSGKTDFEIFNM